MPSFPVFQLYQIKSNILEKEMRKVVHLKTEKTQDIINGKNTKFQISN